MPKIQYLLLARVSPHQPSIVYLQTIHCQSCPYFAMGVPPRAILTFLAFPRNPSLFTVVFASHTGVPSEAEPRLTTASAFMFRHSMQSYPLRFSRYSQTNLEFNACRCSNHYSTPRVSFHIPLNTCHTTKLAVRKRMDTKTIVQYFSCMTSMLQIVMLL